MYKDYKIIGLCISRAVEKSRYSFIKEFNNAALRFGYRVIVYHTCNDFYLDNLRSRCEGKIFEIIDFSVVDAIVIFKESFRRDDIVKLIEDKCNSAGKPLVVVGEKEDNCINFVLDYISGFEAIVRHVVEFHKARDICFIAGRKGDSFSDRRIAVFKKVLSENDISFDDREDLFYGDYWWGPTLEALNVIFCRKKFPDAIICANDSMAITVCEELKKNGVNVPEDVIVTGFDGTDEAKSCTPPITTSKCNVSLLMNNLFKTVDKHLAGINQYGSFFVPYDIDIYRSCGCKGHDFSLNYGDLLKKTNDRFYRYQSDELLFSEMAERAVDYITPESLARLIDEYNFYNLTIFLTGACFDRTINPAESDVFSTDDIFLYFKSEEKKYSCQTIMTHEIMMEELEYFVKTGSPALFNILSFLGRPMGFACFYFAEDYESYCKLIQFVTALNNTIGNYRLVNNLRYVNEMSLLISKTDSMTGLYNRKGFAEKSREIIDSSDEQMTAVVVSIDLNGLKEINDCFGHENGDFAIISVADAIKSVRLERLVSGRFGGDEFVICAVVSDETFATTIENDIVKYLYNLNCTSSKPYKVSASIGIEISSVGEYDFEAMLRAADEKMYSDKHHKGGSRSERKLLDN